jgi:hypothetical protein
VLNDIFRYISEEEDEEVEEEFGEDENEPSDIAEPKDELVAAPIEAEVAEVEEITKKLEQEGLKDGDSIDALQADAKAGKVETPAQTKTIAAAPETRSAAATNGVSKENSDEEAPAAAAAAQIATEEDEPKDLPAEVPSEPVPTPVTTTPVPEAKAAPPTAAKPATAKTWASMLGNKPAAATPVTPALVANAVAPTSTPRQTPAPRVTAAQPAAAEPSPTVVSSPGWKTAESKRQQRPVSVSGDDRRVVMGYIGNVGKQITNEALKNYLTKFGLLEDFDIARDKV